MSGYPDNRRIAIKPYVYNAKKRFYGRAEIDPIRAKMDFTQIVDEVVAQFTRGRTQKSLSRSISKRKIRTV